MRRPHKPEQRIVFVVNIPDPDGFSLEGAPVICTSASCSRKLKTWLASKSVTETTLPRKNVSGASSLSLLPGSPHNAVPAENIQNNTMPAIAMRNLCFTSTPSCLPTMARGPAEKGE